VSVCHHRYRHLQRHSPQNHHCHAVSFIAVPIYGINVCKTLEMGIGHASGRQERSQRKFQSVFCRWIYFHLHSFKSRMVFTARCYASAVLAMGLCLSVCLSVSVTSRSSTKTAKCRITQTTPHDSPGTLVFWCQRSPRNSTGVTPYGGTKCRWSGSESATFNK